MANRVATIDGTIDSADSTGGQCLPDLVAAIKSMPWRFAEQAGEVGLVCSDDIAARTSCDIPSSSCAATRAGLSERRGTIYALGDVELVQPIAFRASLLGGHAAPIR